LKIIESLRNVYIESFTCESDKIDHLFDEKFGKVTVNIVDQLIRNDMTADNIDDEFNNQLSLYNQHFLRCKTMKIRNNSECDIQIELFDVVLR
jgi:hypothetical protein